MSIFKECDESWDWLLSQDLDLIEHRVRWVACGPHENLGQPGLHILNPDGNAVAKAYDTACRELCHVIYLHYDNVRQLKRR